MADDRGWIGLDFVPQTSSVHRALDVVAETIPFWDSAGRMIHPYDNETQTRWDRGELQVQLVQPNNPRPIGFCDGSDADEAELRAMAEGEGADEFVVQKKRLKSGREIWTLGGGSAGDADSDDF
jgi:hypothetical protein